MVVDATDLVRHEDATRRTQGALEGTGGCSSLAELAPLTVRRVRAESVCRAAESAALSEAFLANMFKSLRCRNLTSRVFDDKRLF